MSLRVVTILVEDGYPTLARRIDPATGIAEDNTQAFYLPDEGERYLLGLPEENEPEEERDIMDVFRSDEAMESFGVKRP